MKITPEMINDSPDLVQQFLQRGTHLLEQETWCEMYTGRSWFYDLSHEWAPHLALMCDAREVEFGDYPLLAPLGGCDHPYDIALPCALKNWQHYKPTDEELAQWWSAQ